MKKCGKYEKKPTEAAVKQPKVKNVLLQTYVVSLICMLLCITMFFGTSFAWFTSEVNNVGNEIYIGTLAVGLYKENGQDLADPNHKLFDKNIRWEPGFTALETIQVVNEGDLAFKYALSFLDGTVTGGSQTLGLESVAKHFDVWIYDYYDNGQQPPVCDSYDDISTDNNWYYIGTLAEVLSGKAVITGNMETVRDGNQKPEDANKGTTDGVKTIDTYTIALHMRENADTSVMGHKISLNVKLVAYQKSQESDSFGDKYDEAQCVSTVKELQDALNNATGEVVIRITDDIAGDVTVTQKEGVKIIIDGDGHEFKGSMVVDGQSARFATAALNIRNVNFVTDGISADAAICLGNGNNATRYTSNVTVEKCTFSGSGEEKAAVKSFTGGDVNLTVTVCQVNEGMHSLAQLANVEQGLTITDCKVYSKNGINLNETPSLEMRGCIFSVKGYAVRFGTNGAATDFVKNFTIKNCTLETSALPESGDAVIIFRGTATRANLTLTNTALKPTNGVAEIIGNTADTVIVKN